MLKSSKKITSLLISLIIVFASIVPIFYVSGIEPDETTLKNDLISAWQALAADTKQCKEIIARPSSSWGSVAPTAVTSETKIDDLADISVLGDTYISKLPVASVGWSKQYNMALADKVPPLTDYDDVSIYMCGYDSTGTATKIKVATQVANANQKGNEFTGWNPTEVAKVTGGIKFVIESATNLASLSVGCVVGTRTVTGAPLPEGYEELSLSVLVTKASRVDYEGFSKGEAFKEALAAAKKFINANKDAAVLSNLISAWTKLAAEEITLSDVIAYPMPSDRKAVDPSIKTTYSLTDDEYNSLGGYYACVDITTADNGDLFFRNEKGEDGLPSFVGYDKFSVFVKTMDADYKEANGCLTFQVNEGKDGSQASYPWPQTLNPKWMYTIKSTNAR